MFLGKSENGKRLLLLEISTSYPIDIGVKLYRSPNGRFFITDFNNKGNFIQLNNVISVTEARQLHALHCENILQREISI